MATPEWLNDDYVASLLASEATDSSSSRKKPADKPKPNTRFLKNVIKSTDSHNKALLAKEAAESKARLGVLEQTAETQRLKMNPNAKDIRKRQMAGIHAILGGGPAKKRIRDGESATRSSRTEHREERSQRERSGKSHDLVRERGDRSRDHGRLRESDSDRENDRERRRGKRSSRRHESDDEDRHRHSRRREKGRSRSPEDRRSRRHRRRREEDRSRSRSRTRSPRRRRSPSRSTSRDASPRQRDQSHHKPSSSRRRPPEDSNRQRSPSPASDPLESLLGPAPAPKYRGRGTIASSSGIDRRFSASYDPTTDITMEEDPAADSSNPHAGPASNWDDAVEAFRDRQKMRQAQEDRLREAGFREEDIKKMSGEVVDAQDVSFQWSKAGEKREWDLGKEGGRPGEEDGLLNRARWAGGKAPTGLFSADDEF